jgi:hypothetical protein
MKKLIASVCFVFFACLAFAQQGIPAGNGQLWWGYYGGDESSWNIDGLGGLTTYCVAINIPADFVTKPGGTVAAASIYMISYHFKDLKVWVSKALPKRASEADMECVDVPNSMVRMKDFTDVAFSREHVIPDEGLYVGYEFTITQLTGNYDNYPLVYSGQSDASGTFLISQSGSGQWANWSSYAESLVMRVLLSGDKFMQNAVEASGMGQRYTLLGGEADGYVSLLNRGTNGISSIDYVVDTEDVKGSEQHVALPEKFSTLGGLTSVNIPLKADATTGNKLKTLRVTKVNGKANEAGEGESQGALFTVAKKVALTPVIEEFTGNRCGWCPRDMVGMEMLKEEYADRIVGISVHYNDPMELKEYYPVIAMTNQLPSALIGRRRKVDPYDGSSLSPFGIKDEVERFFNEVTAASVEATAQWADAEKTKIQVKTSTTFQFDDDDPLMGIGYVLLADGLKDNSWKQLNYYSGSSQYQFDDHLSPWIAKSEEVSGLEYQSVAVAVEGIAKGVPGSIAGPVRAGQSQQYSHVFDIPATALVQDKEKLSVAVLLLNGLAGDVMNGQRVPIQPFDASGVNVVDAAEKPVVSVYSLDGRKLSAPVKGVNILKFSDGRSKKVTF